MSCLKFTRAHRLLTRPQYEQCYQRGRRFFLPSFIVYVSPQKEAANSRLGLTVSKKTGCAVKRNQIKRVLREVFRQKRQELPFVADLIFIPKRKLYSLDFAQADTQWQLLVKKLSQQ